MSLTLKFTSLVIRTAAKPISNYIKSQAREHDRFKKLCVSFAQRIHRIDMRLRLGLLQDPATIDRQIARAEREAQAKRKKEHPEESYPTAKTKEQSEAEDAANKKEKKEITERVRTRDKERTNQMLKMVRPLSEAKAIDSGANFISESFLFLVASGLILFETWRSRRKDQSRRADISERLEALEEDLQKARDDGAASKRRLIALRSEVERLHADASSRGTSGKAADDSDSSRPSRPTLPAGDGQRSNEHPTSKTQ